MSRLVECLRCGRPRSFAPGQTERRCGECEIAVPIPAQLDPAIAVHDIDAAEHTRAPPLMPPLTRPASLCELCDAVLSGPVQVTACPSCGSMTQRLDAPECMPADGILPFVVDRPRARAAIELALASIYLKKEPPRIVAIEPLFAPWWILSWETKTRYKGQRGDIDRGSRSNSRIIWSDWSGEVERPWPFVEHSGSRLLPEEMTRRLSPWDWPFAEACGPARVIDERSEHTRVPPAEVIASRMPEIDREIRTVIVDDIGGDRQRIASLSTELMAKLYRIVLVPLWIAELSDGARAAVNGRTGEAVIEGRAAQQVTDDDLLDQPPSQAFATKIVLTAVGLCVLVLLATKLFF